MTVFVTRHAIQRYIERIGGTEEQAREALQTPMIEQAAKLGYETSVRLPSGHLAVCKDNTVITLLPKHRVTQKKPKGKSKKYRESKCFRH